MVPLQGRHCTSKPLYKGGFCHAVGSGRQLFSKSSKTDEYLVTCPASSSGSASSGSSASVSPTTRFFGRHTHKIFDSFNAHPNCKPPKLNASPRRRWASTGLGGELQPQHHAPSPSRGSGHAGSACRQHWGKHDAPAFLFFGDWTAAT